MSELLGYFKSPYPVIGRVRAVAVPNPAAGAEWSFTPDSGRVWRLLAGRFVFATSAVVANRLVTVAVVADGQRVFRGWDNTLIAAGNTNEYSLVDNKATSVPNHGNGLGLIPTIGCWLPEGASIGSVTGGIDVADQYSGVNLLVQEAWTSPHEVGRIEERLQQIAQLAAHPAHLHT